MFNKYISRLNQNGVVTDQDLAKIEGSLELSFIEEAIINPLRNPTGKYWDVGLNAASKQRLRFAITLIQEPYFATLINKIMSSKTSPHLERALTVTESVPSARFNDEVLDSQLKDAGKVFRRNLKAARTARSVGAERRDESQRQDPVAEKAPGSGFVSRILRCVLGASPFGRGE